MWPELRRCSSSVCKHRPGLKHFIPSGSYILMNPLAPLCCCNLISPRCNTQVQGWASWLCACLKDQSSSESHPPPPPSLHASLLGTAILWSGLATAVETADVAPQFSLKDAWLRFLLRLLEANVMLKGRSVVHTPWLAGGTGSRKWINYSLFSPNTSRPVVLEQSARPSLVPVSK